MKTTTNNKYPDGYKSKIVYWTNKFINAKTLQETELAQSKINYFKEQQQTLELESAMKKTNAETKTGIVTELCSEIRWLQSKVEQLKSRLADDFLYSFAWAGEDLFRQEFKLTQLGYKLRYLCDNEIDLSEIEKIQIIIKDYQAILDQSYSVRENSTGSLHREVSTWKYQEMLELKKFFQNLIK